MCPLLVTCELRQGGEAAAKEEANTRLGERVKGTKEVGGGGETGWRYNWREEDKPVEDR